MMEYAENQQDSVMHLEIWKGAETEKVVLHKVDFNSQDNLRVYADGNSELEWQNRKNDFTRDFCWPINQDGIEEECECQNIRGLLLPAKFKLYSFDNKGKVDDESNEVVKMPTLKDMDLLTEERRAEELRR